MRIGKPGFVAINDSPGYVEENMLCYGLVADQIRAYAGNPIDMLNPETLGIRAARLD